MLKPTERFSSRVDDYVKYRPSYPLAVVDLARTEFGMTADWTIADIGSGPGNLTRLFLDNGNKLFGVEPNKEMREAGERLMAGYPSFVSVNGTAETTGLEGESVDLITAGQAFHWFELEPTRSEFQRILKPGGWVALVWNERRLGFNRFSDEYERILLNFAPDYPSVKHMDDDRSKIEALFGDELRQATFDYMQTLDWEGFVGRVMSSSYIPQKGQPLHEEIVAALRKLFEEEALADTVSFVYDTQVFYGRV